MGRKQGDWTPEREQMLRDLVGTGSASDIAAQLGGVSRNAVIGKLHRMGLISRSSPEQRRERCAAAAKRTWANSATREQRIARLKETRRLVMLLPKMRSLRAMPRPKPSRKGYMPLLSASGCVSIVDVTDTQCKYIPGDDHLCCGAPAVKGLPYCAGHAQLCYALPEPAKRPPQQPAQVRPAINPMFAGVGTD